VSLRAIIADDEALAREGLRLLLGETPDVEVIAECANGREAIEVLREHNSDVLFLDIEMPGIGGFGVIQQGNVPDLPLIVFVTAHNEYAIKAFEVEALDYLTKPVESERLQQTLRRVRERLASQAAPITQEQLKSVLGRLGEGSFADAKYPQRILVPNGAKDVFVDVDQIEWIEAESYYSCLHVGNKKYLIRETIKQFAMTLNPHKFVRVHRSAIVNIAYVREILREGQQEGWLQLASGQRVKMSKPGWQDLLSATRR